MYVIAHISIGIFKKGLCSILQISTYHMTIYNPEIRLIDMRRQVGTSWGINKIGNKQ